MVTKTLIEVLLSTLPKSFHANVSLLLSSRVCLLQRVFTLINLTTILEANVTVRRNIASTFVTSLQIKWRDPKFQIATRAVLPTFAELAETEAKRADSAEAQLRELQPQLAALKADQKR